MNEKTIHQIEDRISRLEKAVFGSKKRQKQKPNALDFTGPSGGIRLLISQHFFKSKKSLADVRSALAKIDYHYSAQAVQTAINRMSGRDGLLVAFKEGGKKLYVNRK